MIQQLEIKATGLADLLMHNVRLANPLGEWSRKIKEITGKKNKTDADYEALAKIEWEGGAYHTDELGLYIPGGNIEASLADVGAKRRRDVLCAITVEDAPINYKGPKDLPSLWADKDEKFRDFRSVVVNKSKVFRTRLRIPLPWSVTLTVGFDDEYFNERDVHALFEKAGRIGWLDFTPKFGRFEVGE